MARVGCRVFTVVNPHHRRAAGAGARLRADAGCYAFVAVDPDHLLLAGLAAQSRKTSVPLLRILSISTGCVYLVAMTDFPDVLVVCQAPRNTGMTTEEP